MAITKEQAEKIHAQSDSYFEVQRTEDLTLCINGHDVLGKVQEIGVSFAKKRLEIMYEIPIKNMQTGFLSSFAGARATTVWQDVTLRSASFQEYVDANDEAPEGMIYVPFFVDYI